MHWHLLLLLYSCGSVCLLVGLPLFLILLADAPESSEAAKGETTWTSLGVHLYGAKEGARPVTVVDFLCTHCAGVLLLFTCMGYNCDYSGG